METNCTSSNYNNNHNNHDNVHNSDWHGNMTPNTFMYISSCMLHLLCIYIYYMDIERGSTLINTYIYIYKYI